MPEGEWTEHRNDGYRALGRYFAEFSELVWLLERTMVDHLKSRGVDHTIAHLPFGALTAAPMAAVFFDMAAQLREHDDKEQRIARKLRKEVSGALPFRNDAAHGAWIIGGAQRPDDGALPTPVPPTLLRTKPGRGDGALTIDQGDLDARADELRQLQAYVSQYAHVCFKQPEGLSIRDFVRLDETGKKLVPGPRSPGAPSLD